MEPSRSEMLEPPRRPALHGLRAQAIDTVLAFA